jgi:hypothetical protein
MHRIRYDFCDFDQGNTEGEKNIGTAVVQHSGCAWYREGATLPIGQIRKLDSAGMSRV